MKHALCLLALPVTIAFASFGPSVRIDHSDVPTNWMQSPAITLGPRTPSGQTVYVAFQKDSLLLTGSANTLANTSCIMFQKSTAVGHGCLLMCSFTAAVHLRNGPT